MVPAIAFGASQTGVAVSDDLATGMVDRVRSFPIAGAAFLAGRVASDAVRNLFVVDLMIGVASAIGFRFHAGGAATLAAIALAVAVGLAFPGAVFFPLGRRRGSALAIGAVVRLLRCDVFSETFTSNSRP